MTDVCLQPDIKKLQIQLTGFLEKDTPAFCKELWKLCLSAQSNPQGVPKELLEAKKAELIQEKVWPHFGGTHPLTDLCRLMQKRLPMRIDVDVRWKSAVRERSTQLEIASEESVVEGVLAETVGAEDAAIAEVSIAEEGTMIGEVLEDQGRQFIGVEIPEIEDHFEAPHHPETLTPTFQVAVVTAEEMNAAVDRLLVQSLQPARYRAHAHARLRVDVARLRSLYLQNRGEEVNHLIGAAGHTMAKAVVGEEAWTVFSGGGPTHHQMFLGHGLHRHGSGVGHLRNLEVRHLLQDHGTAADGTHHRDPGLGFPLLIALRVGAPSAGVEIHAYQDMMIRT